MKEDKLIDLTADIVAAYVANNHVGVRDLARLVKQVHTALAARDTATEDSLKPKVKTPVVSIRKSVKPDHLVCLECGKKQKALKRHLQTAHGMAPDQYRQEYGLPSDYPMVAAEYSERRRSLAHAIGLGRKTSAVSLEPRRARHGQPRSVSTRGQA